MTGYIDVMIWLFVFLTIKYIVGPSVTEDGRQWNDSGTVAIWHRCLPTEEFAQPIRGSP